jgi:hypothetical protein
MCDIQVNVKPFDIQFDIKLLILARAANSAVP